VGLPELELTQWIRTHWASLCNALDRFLQLQAAVTRFIQLADDSEEVPALVGKSYADYRLGKKDWAQLALIHEVLKVHFTHLQVIATDICWEGTGQCNTTFSSSTNPTVWRTIPILGFLQQSWENMASMPKFATLAPGICAGLKNLAKWYRKTDDTYVYFICLGEVILSYN
jgi:hypothetical protein